MKLTGQKNQCPSCGEFFNSNFAFEKHRTGKFGDVDGTGPERWLGRAVACFDTEDEALDFVDNHYEICEVVEECL